MSKDAPAKPVKLSILEKEYLVSCTDEQYPELLESAQYVDKKMREIRDGGKVIGAERVAVTAALNIAHELLGGDTPKRSEANQRLQSRLKHLHEKIDEALYKSRQLEL